MSQAPVTACPRCGASNQCDAENSCVGEDCPLPDTGDDFPAALVAYDEMVANALPCAKCTNHERCSERGCFDRAMSAPAPRMTYGVALISKASDAAVTDALLNHAYGPATCDDCQHKWIAVWPLGLGPLECPKCHSTNTERTQQC